MQKNKNKPYLIVGQGIAGTCLSFALKQRDIEHTVINFPGKKSASQIAAGLINPLTGRHFVKSWYVEQLIPMAIDTYTKMAAYLGIDLFDKTQIHLLFQTSKVLNDWHMRTTQFDVGHYAGEVDNGGEFTTHFPQTIARAKVLDGARVDLKKLIDAYKERLKQEGHYQENEFNHRSLIDENGQVSDQWERIIFCEGAHAVNNPFFNYLPFWPTKGEVLRVHIPDYKHRKEIIKCGLFIIPTQEDQIYWVGSTYDKVFEDDKPEAVKKEQLEQRLKQVLASPYTIVKHQAAIRPTVKDRKPFIGKHPLFDKLFIFNGMGAKGTSLAPYFAEHFCKYLFDGDSLMPLVDIERYASLHKP